MTIAGSARCPLRTWAIVFATGVALLSSAEARAQPSPGLSAVPKEGSRDAGAPTASANDGGVLGHSLPAGHPPVEEERAEEEERGHMFEAPKDAVEDDPELPAGTIIATLRDPQRRPIPRAKATLVIARNSTAKGDSMERRDAIVDEDGSARFADLPIGRHVVYRLSAARGPAQFASPPFQLGEGAGKRVSLHVYPTVDDLGRLRVGSWGIVYLVLRDDAISVEHHVTVLNVDPVAWVPNDYSFALPPGFKAFNRSDDAGDIAFEEVKGERASLRGTVVPGQHEISFRYQVPLDAEDRQTLRIQLPPKTFQVGVMVEASKTMGLEVTGFPAAWRSERNGKRLLVTKKQASADELRAVEITLSGLPTPGPGRWIAVAFGLAALVGGVTYARSRSGGELDDDQRSDLVDAKDALLDELVALERARAAGEVGPKAYARVRAALLDALGRIVDQIRGRRAEQPAHRGS